MAKEKKAKKIAEGVFETPETKDTFGRKVEVQGGAIQELSTEATRPLVDDASGERYVLRRFVFKLPPGQTKWVDKAKLLAGHERFIKEFCWKDGLVVNTAVPPRIRISKDKTECQIFVLTEAKLGATILEKPLTLQEITKPYATSRHKQ